MTADDRQPTAEDYATMADQCSQLEWSQLLIHGPFLDSCFISIAATEKAASAFLGRKISATPSHGLKPSENEAL